MDLRRTNKEGVLWQSESPGWWVTDPQSERAFSECPQWMRGWCSENGTHDYVSKPWLTYQVPVVVSPCQTSHLRVSSGLHSHFPGGQQPPGSEALVSPFAYTRSWVLLVLRHPISGLPVPWSHRCRAESGQLVPWLSFSGCPWERTDAHKYIN